MSYDPFLYANGVADRPSPNRCRLIPLTPLPDQREWSGIAKLIIGGVVFFGALIAVCGLIVGVFGR